MGAYKFLEELWRKKQSDVMRYLLRIRCWEYRQLPVTHRASRPSRPAKVRVGASPSRLCARARVRVPGATGDAMAHARGLDRRAASATRPSRASSSTARACAAEAASAR
jgi:ribosomal protein L15E